MKKIAVLLIPVIMMAIASCKKENEIVQNDGKVDFVVGTATMEYQGSTEKLVLGSIVREGAVVVTGGKSFVNLAFAENIIRIMENSKITITNSKADKTGGTMQTETTLQEGKVFSHVAKKMVKGDVFLVKTPTTVASVRGTNFLVATSKGKSTVSCLNGSIEVKKADAPATEAAVEVKEGEGIAVESGKEVAIKKLSDEEIAQMLDILESIKNKDETTTVPLQNRPLPDYDAKH